MSELCGYCDGTGEVEAVRDWSPSEETGGMGELTGTVPCEHCGGTGIKQIEVEP